MNTCFRTLRRIVGRTGRRLVSLATESPTSGGGDLTGDRDIEWSWVVAKIGNGPGRVLDFGSGPFGFLCLVAARREFEVVSLDRQLIFWPFLEPNIRFIQEDILKVNLPPKSFDLIINCSTVEHVGLDGRYGTTDFGPDGDLKAMCVLRRLMKPGAIMFLTIPVGRDEVFPPLHRVYGVERLPKLLKGYDIVDEEYWIKDDQNRWIKSQKEVALNHKARPRLYGLGCFELKISNVERPC